jgi:hypothetical protein
MKFISPILDKLSHNQTNILVFDCEFWHVFDKINNVEYFNETNYFFTPREIAGFLLTKDKEWKLHSNFFVTLDKPSDDVTLPITKFASVGIETAAKLDEIVDKIGMEWNNVHSSILNKYQQKLFKKAINIYKNDSNINKHHKTNRWIKQFLKIYSNSTIIVKGSEDIKSLKNICNILDYEYLEPKHIIDISLFNKKSKNMCGSAKLFDSFNCIYNKLPYEIKQFLPYLEVKEAHDPRTDASMTLIVAMYFMK